MNSNGLTRRENAPKVPQPAPLHPAWAEFVRFCRDLKHGEIENLKIQDGVPLMAEMVRRKVKFTE